MTYVSVPGSTGKGGWSDSGSGISYKSSGSASDKKYFFFNFMEKMFLMPTELKNITFW